MRRDMEKVIIERPRAGGMKVGRDRLPVHKILRDENGIEEFDGGPRTITPRRMAINKLGWDIKEQTDVIGPLRGYLHKCVGRKWDDVWQEICKNSSKNLVGQHLRRHVEMEIEFPICREGRLYTPEGYPFTAESYRAREFYVNPVNGVLYECKNTPRRRRGNEKDNIFELNGRLFYYDNGMWYRVVMDEINIKPDSVVQDAFCGSVHVGSTGFILYGLYFSGKNKDLYRYDYANHFFRNRYRYKGKTLRCVSKQSANGREIKALKKKHAIWW